MLTLELVAHKKPVEKAHDAQLSYLEDSTPKSLRFRLVGGTPKPHVTPHDLGGEWCNGEQGCTRDLLVT